MNESSAGGDLGPLGPAEFPPLLHLIERIRPTFEALYAHLHSPDCPEVRNQAEGAAVVARILMELDRLRPLLSGVAPEDFFEGLDPEEAAEAYADMHDPESPAARAAGLN